MPVLHPDGSFLPEDSSRFEEAEGKEHSDLVRRYNLLPPESAPDLFLQPCQPEPGKLQNPLPHFHLSLLRNFLPESGPKDPFLHMRKPH